MFVNKKYEKKILNKKINYGIFSLKIMKAQIWKS